MYTIIDHSPDLFLTYYKYTEQIRKVIRSTNMIERLNKEIRRRIKIIDSLPGEESARKIIYLRIIEENDKFSGRTILGFNICKDDIMRTFDMRYP
ncbi:MAG: transposase [Candidatus Nanopusillus acidilobi]